jgi:hypothetical protein
LSRLKKALNTPRGLSKGTAAIPERERLREYAHYSLHGTESARTPQARNSNFELQFFDYQCAYDLRHSK